MCMTDENGWSTPWDRSEYLERIADEEEFDENYFDDLRHHIWDDDDYLLEDD